MDAGTFRLLVAKKKLTGLGSGVWTERQRHSLINNVL